MKTISNCAEWFVAAATPRCREKDKIRKNNCNEKKLNLTLLEGGTVPQDWRRTRNTGEIFSFSWLEFLEPPSNILNSPQTKFRIEQEKCPVRKEKELSQNFAKFFPNSYLILKFWNNKRSNLSLVFLTSRRLASHTRKYLEDQNMASLW